MIIEKAKKKKRKIVIRLVYYIYYQESKLFYLMRNFWRNNFKILFDCGLINNNAILVFMILKYL